MQVSKIITMLFLLTAATTMFGCKSMNQRMGKDSTAYADAREAKLLKFPRGALMPSTRYDIPYVAGNSDQIIADPVPPDYQITPAPYIPDTPLPGSQA